MKTLHLPSWTILCLLASCGAVAAADTPPPADAPLKADEAREVQGRWATHLGRDVIRENSIGMKMVLVPPGEFTQGTTRKDLDAIIAHFSKEDWWYEGAAGMWGFEVPAHRVKLTKPYELAATEVTVAQFRRFTDESGYKTEAEHGWFRGKPSEREGFPKFTWRNAGYDQQDDEPVTHSSWRDAMAFCEWLSEKEGGRYHLPSEAQWEHACRAGTATRWVSGDDFSGAAQYGWIDGKQPRGVATKRANAFGIYDMHGNVWEYCNEWWSWDYMSFSESESPSVDPPGPAEMPKERPLRTLRGGSFDFGASSRSACRVRVHQTTHRFRHLGFRVARRIE